MRKVTETISCDGCGEEITNANRTPNVVEWVGKNADVRFDVSFTIGGKAADMCDECTANALQAAAYVCRGIDPHPK